MTERKYSVAEIDDLRRVMERKFLFGTYTIPTEECCSRSYREDEKTKCVEEYVRTAMLAGHVAADYLTCE